MIEFSSRWIQKRLKRWDAPSNVILLWLKFDFTWKTDRLGFDAKVTCECEPSRSGEESLSNDTNNIILVSLSLYPQFCLTEKRINWKYAVSFMSKYAKAD